MITNELIKAKEFFYKKDYNSARALFIKRNDYYGAGLCSLLLKDVIRAQKYWKMNKKECFASSWGLCFLKYIDLKTSAEPTFFQTRAFLEVYLNLLFENNLIEWAENVLSCSDSIARSNPETYKFIARALFANGYFSLSCVFCKKSLRLFYADPEAFLILSQCQFLTNNLGDAIDSVNRIVDMVPDYYPALLFRKILKEEANKKRI